MNNILLSLIALVFCLIIILSIAIYRLSNEVALLKASERAVQSTISNLWRYVDRHEASVSASFSMSASLSDSYSEEIPEDIESDLPYYKYEEPYKSTTSSNHCKYCHWPFEDGKGATCTRCGAPK